MKSLSIEIDDSLYDALVALLRQMPKEKVHILEKPIEPGPAVDFERAMDDTLKKNAELYKRLA